MPIEVSEATQKIDQKASYAIKMNESVLSSVTKFQGGSIEASPVAVSLYVALKFGNSSQSAI